MYGTLATSPGLLFLRTFLAACFLLTLSCLSSPAQFTTTNDGYQVTITKYAGSGTVVIPSTINGLPVSEIGDSAFKGTGVTSVSISYGVRRIGKSAFSDCTSLQSLSLPDSLSTIDDNAFWNCTSLVTVQVPRVASFGAGVFGGCSQLTSFTLPVGNSIMSTVDGVLLDLTKTRLIQFPPGLRRNGTYTIPSTVTTVAEQAFAGSFLKEVIIPSSVKEIEDNAFYYLRNLINLTIPRTVTSLGYGSFYACYNLETITVGATDIGERAFYNCSHIESLTLSPGVTSIGVDAFPHARITSLKLPSSVTSIGDRAFNYCKMTEVTIPAKVQTIGSEAFAGSELTAIQVTGLNPYFSSASGVLFDRARTVLKQYPGSRAGATYVVPEGVRLIEPSSFASNPGLTRVNFPASLKEIGQFAFADCSNLANAFFKGEAPKVGYDAFEGTAADFRISFYRGAPGFVAPAWVDSNGTSHPSVALSPPALPPVITSPLAVTKTYRFGFPYKITATNFPTKFTASPLPKGVVLDPATGQFSGDILATVGVYPVTITATNAYGTARARLVITVDKLSQYIIPPNYPEQTYGVAPLLFKGWATSEFRVSVKVVSGPATYANDYLTLTGAGTVVVSLNQPGNVNFLPAPELRVTLVVKKANQTITFPDLGFLKIGVPVKLKATASSKLPVRYELAFPSELKGGTFTPKEGGVRTLRAVQAGDANYNPAEPVHRDFEVSQN